MRPRPFAPYTWAWIIWTFAVLALCVGVLALSGCASGRLVADCVTNPRCDL